MDDVLSAEREHLDRARADLARMRAHIRELLDTQSAWGNDELTTRALSVALARRFDQLLDDGVTPLFFGRLDAESGKEVFHVGRRHVSGADGEPVVVDWRAPVSGPYYRASAQDRQGIALRRRFGFRDGTLTAYEDDRLEGPAATSALLVEEIERPRTGLMRDIVATVQPEQDVLVRAPLEQTVCVQGAPGTGKTAVGLHRAAYLLYAHRARLAATGVLVVGPNRASWRTCRRCCRRSGRCRSPSSRPTSWRRGCRCAAWTTRRRRSSRATPGWRRCWSGRCGGTLGGPTSRSCTRPERAAGACSPRTSGPWSGPCAVAGSAGTPPAPRSRARSRRPSYGSRRTPAGRPTGARSTGWPGPRACGRTWTRSGRR